jgi:F420-non-reducing hydrogenase iron-sulfur subunit
MCTGRIDPSFVLKAFANGTDGVFIGGCWLGECHYLTEGNHHAVSMMNITKKIIRQAGIHTDRLRLEWVSAAHGVRFADVVTDFTKQIREIGALAANEASVENRLDIKLKAAISLVPYVRLVERERLRVHFNTREEYDAYFDGAEVERMFKELVIDKLIVKEIFLLLQEKAYSNEELARIIGITPGEIARHINLATMKGMADFVPGEKRFTSVKV